MLLALLTSCSSTSSKIICLDDVAYTDKQQDQAAAEMKALPDTSIIKSTFMPNYENFRERARACHNMNKSWLNLS